MQLGGAGGGETTLFLVRQRAQSAKSWQGLCHCMATKLNNSASVSFNHTPANPLAMSTCCVGHHRHPLRHGHRPRRQVQGCALKICSCSLCRPAVAGSAAWVTPGQPYAYGQGAGVHRCVARPKARMSRAQPLHAHLPELRQSTGLAGHARC